MRLEAWPPRTAGGPHSRAHPGAPRNHTRPPALRPHSGTPALSASPRRTKRTRRSSRRRGRRRSYLHPAPAQASGERLQCLHACYCSCMCPASTYRVRMPRGGTPFPGSRVWIGDKHLTRLPQRPLHCGGACVTVWPAPSPDSDAYVRAAVRRSLGGMNCWCTGEAPGLVFWLGTQSDVRAHRSPDCTCGV